MSTQNFEKIYQETYNSVLKFVVIKCNNIDDVNDIIQDTYIELLKIMNKNKLPKLDDMSKYILGIANNVIKRHYSKKKKNNIVSYYTDTEDDGTLYIKDDFDLEQDVITKENVAEVWDYVRNKDLVTVKIFYLYFVLDLKISEISKELGIGESNIKNKIYRTLKEIKKFLGKEVN